MSTSKEAQPTVGTHESGFLTPSEAATPPSRQLESPHFEPLRYSGADQHVQFATYKDSDSISAPRLAAPPSSSVQRLQTKWVPLPLRSFFWIPMIIFLVLAAIGLEVALYFSRKNQGFASGKTENERRALHYAYTLPPVFIASVVVAMWAWTDIEIKRLQPYVDLVHGDSPPQRSLLLDYSRQNKVTVCGRAFRNHHYIVALASLMVIMTLTFQPLASALLSTREVWQQDPAITLQTLKSLSLNQDAEFNDLSYFMTGAGYAGASVMYNLPQSPFVKVPYTVAPFQLPTFVTTNGTALVNTTAIKTETGCQKVAVNMMNHTDGSGWTNSASDGQCSFTFQVDHSSGILFGSDVLSCNSDTPPQFSPIALWYFIYKPTAAASVTFCKPTLSFWEVTAGVDIRTGNVTTVTELRPFSSSSAFSSLSANVTGAPLNGRAYNGIAFDLTNPDPFVLARQNATRLQVPAAVYQAANQSPQGFADSFNGDALASLSNRVYGIYLTLIARDVYFLPNSENISVQVRTFRTRVLMSDVATHLLAVALLILALFATLLHIFHREDRRFLRLSQEPGTIASAVSIAAQTGLSEVLADRQGDQDIEEALKDKKFRIDSNTNKIIMEGEYGYEDAASPLFRRKSVMAQMLHGPARRLSTVSSPQTPSTGFRLPTTPNATKSSPGTPAVVA